MTTPNNKRAELRRQFREHNELRQARGYAPILWAEWKPEKKSILGRAMTAAEAGEPVDVEITDLEAFIGSKHNERQS